MGIEKGCSEDCGGNREVGWNREPEFRGDGGIEKQGKEEAEGGGRGQRARREKRNGGCRREK